MVVLSVPFRTCRLKYKVLNVSGTGQVRVRDPGGEKLAIDSMFAFSPDSYVETLTKPQGEGMWGERWPVGGDKECGALENEISGKTPRRASSLPPCGNAGKRGPRGTRTLLSDTASADTLILEFAVCGM